MHSERDPLSFLTLERYALGELSASERAEVEAWLAESESDRDRLASILEDESELPPLPSAPPSLAAAREKRQRRWLLLSSGLAAAAALLLLVQRPQPAHEDAGEHTQGIKGSEVALRLVSDRTGVDPRSFAPGERFKIEVTCPPKLAASLRLLVFQGGEMFEPLPAGLQSCGNLVPWPGAFALDGTESAEVCLYWGEARTPTRESLAQESVCTTLTP